METDKRQLVPWKASKPASLGAWDVDAETEAVRRACSSDGSGEKDTIDWDKYEKFFSLVNRTDRENFASYEGLHHTVRDGEMVVAEEALAGFMDGLNAVPPQLRRRLYNHGRRHYEQFQKEAPTYKFARVTGVELAYPGIHNHLDVTEEKLRRVIDNYDPDFLAAPVTMDHVEEGLSEGWVSNIYWRDGSMYGDFEDVPEYTAELMEGGRLLYPSVVVDNNWTQLYAVGLLGAANPAVEGLAKLKDATIQFSGNKDLLALTCGPKEDETNMPENEKEKLTLFQKFVKAAATTFGVKLKLKSEDDGTISLEAEEERLEFAAKLDAEKKRADDAEAKLAAAAAKERFSAAEAKVDALVKEGRITPAVKDAGLATILAELSADERKLAFSRKEGGQEEATLADRLLFALQQIPEHSLKDKLSDDDAGDGSLDRHKAIGAKHGDLRVAFKKSHEREPNAEEDAGLYEEAVNSVDGRNQS